MSKKCEFFSTTRSDMPVQSKIIAGRGRKPPPVPAPKPILKNSRRTRASPERPAALRLLNGPSPYKDTPTTEVSFPGLNKEILNNDDSSCVNIISRSVEDHRRAAQATQYGATGGDTAQQNTGIISETEDSNCTVIPKEGLNSQSPRPKHGRTYFRPSIGGDWALRECEVSTVWFTCIHLHK